MLMVKATQKSLKFVDHNGWFNSNAVEMRIAKHDLKTFCEFHPLSFSHSGLKSVRENFSII